MTDTAGITCLLYTSSLLDYVSLLLIDVIVFLLTNTRSSCAMIVVLMVTNKSVSYTHLDVYKRQGIGCGPETKHGELLLWMFPRVALPMQIL